MEKQPNAASMLWRIKPQPVSVVGKMFAAIPDSILLDCNRKIADLAMGDGSYLAEVLRRRIANGASYEQAAATLYGYESSPVYLQAAAKLNSLHGSNLAILKPATDLDDFEMQFDVVIGNPPYQAPKNANGAKNAYPLWRRFIIKAQDLLKNGGYVSLLVPSQVAKFHEEGKSSPALQKTSSLCVTSVCTGMESYFNVGSEISLITFVKGQQSDTILLNGGVWDWKSRPWVPTSTLPSHLSLLNKLFMPKARIKFVPQHHRDDFIVDVNRSIGCWGMNRGKNYGMMDLSLVDKRTVHMMVSEFESREEQQAALLLFASPVYQFLKKMLMFGSDVSFKTLSSLPVPEGWQHIKSSDEVVELFGLTQEETEHVLSY